MITRRIALLTILIGTACGGGGSDEWQFRFTCLLGEGEFEERRVSIPCGTGAGAACNLEQAEQLARQQVPETCGGVQPAVVEPTECPGCPSE
jgi:hypothetical protein